MLTVLNPLVMLLLLIALGGSLYRVKLLDLDFCRRLSRLVVSVAYPALLFVSMYNNTDLAALQKGWMFSVVGLATSTVLAITSRYSSRHFGLKGMTSGTYQILCTNGNNIFLPVPIIRVLFGSPYVVYAVLYELGAGLFYWSYGVSHFRPGARLNLKRLVNPKMIALLVGLALGLGGVSLPTFLYGALEIIGNIVVGSAMLIMGALAFSLLDRGWQPRREVWGVVLHRLVLSPMVGALVLVLVALPNELRVILLLMSSMPPLVTTALVAASYDADEELAAMGVVIPTLLSFITLPLILSIL